MYIFFFIVVFCRKILRFLDFCFSCSKYFYVIDMFLFMNFVYYYIILVIMVVIKCRFYKIN